MARDIHRTFVKVSRTNRSKCHCAPPTRRAPDARCPNSPVGLAIPGHDARCDGAVPVGAANPAVPPRPAWQRSRTITGMARTGAAAPLGSRARRHDRRVWASPSSARVATSARPTRPRPRKCTSRSSDQGPRFWSSMLRQLRAGHRHEARAALRAARSRSHGHRAIGVVSGVDGTLLLRVTPSSWRAVAGRAAINTPSGSAELSVLPHDPRAAERVRGRPQAPAVHGHRMEGRQAARVSLLAAAVRSRRLRDVRHTASSRCTQR